MFQIFEGSHELLFNLRLANPKPAIYNQQLSLHL